MADQHSNLFEKVILLITEDWFVLSHFRPLILTLLDIANDVVVVTRSSGRMQEIEALGARTVHFDFGRAANGPATIARQVQNLCRVIKTERPDVVHMIALKPILLGGLALKFVARTNAVVHVTGQGLLQFGSVRKLRFYRYVLMKVMADMLKRPSSYLLVENPDDLEALRLEATDPGVRYSILGGAGVDPDALPALPPPINSVPVAAHVGRMIHSKGVDLLMQAYDQLQAQGVQMKLDLFGRCDPDNPGTLTPDTLADWCETSGASWGGHVDDVAAIWRARDIFVLASRGGEGLPRALLEAAACARPLVVTNVPGNRHFVRQGVEGFLVPPGDVVALSSALALLAGDATLRIRMGNAARRRLLNGYTEANLKAVVRSAYETISNMRGTKKK